MISIIEVTMTLKRHRINFYNLIKLCIKRRFTQITINPSDLVNFFIYTLRKQQISKSDQELFLLRYLILHI